MAEIDLAPSLNSVSHDKKSASVRQADVPKNLSPTKNLQLCDKKSASVRRPLLSRVDNLISAPNFYCYNFNGRAVPWAFSAGKCRKKVEFSA